MGVDDPFGQRRGANVCALKGGGETRSSNSEERVTVRSRVVAEEVRVSSEQTKPGVYTLKVDTNNSLVFEVRGSGTPLIFLHGWSCRRADWKSITAELSKQFLTVSIDLPGHGDAVATRSWSIKEFGGLVSDVVKRLDLSNVRIIGHSMGGAVALESAIQLGSKCQQVVAVDSLTYLGIYPPQLDSSFMAGMEALQADFSGTMLALVTSLGAPTTSDAVNSTVAFEMAEADPNFALPLIMDLYRWDMYATLPKVACPITVVAAKCHLSDEAIEALSGSMNIHSVDFGGHFFLREDPQKTTIKLREILNS